MNWNDRNVWPQKARQALDEFARLGIELPQPVTDAVAVLRRVEATEPTTPSQTALREAFIAGADRKTLDALLVAALGSTRLRSEWGQARTDSAGGVLAAIRNAEPSIMPQLTKQADALISKLKRTADLGGIRLEVLVKAGRQSDAALLADRDSAAAALSNLYTVRDYFLVRGGGAALNINGVSCAVWKDPEGAAEHARGKSVAEQYINGLTAGVPLWFPSPAEAQAAAQEIADRRAAAAQRRREREHGVGSTVAFG